MTILVTGSAGFIGSHVVRALQAAGHSVCPVDPRDSDTWPYLPLDSFEPAAVVHLGAITDTTVEDSEALYATNVDLPQRLWDWCTEHGKPLVYASSAAVYGRGLRGFHECAPLDPLNPYAHSKATFDRLATWSRATPPTWAGLRFFNVYGPGEQHKGRMASMVSQAFYAAERHDPLNLFKWGGQRRDFVYVDDVVRVILWALDADVHGLYNVGTGHAASFASMLGAVQRVRPWLPVEWVTMPNHLTRRFQNHTEADLTRLRAAGYDGDFLTLAEGVELMADIV